MKTKMFKNFIDSSKKDGEDTRLTGEEKLQIVKELMEILELDENDQEFNAGLMAFHLEESPKFLKFKKEVLKRNPHNQIIKGKLSRIGDFTAHINRAQIVALLDFFARELIVTGATEILAQKTFEQTAVTLTPANCLTTIITNGEGFLSEDIITTATTIKALQDNHQRQDSLTNVDDQIFLPNHQTDIFHNFSLTPEDQQTILDIIQTCLPSEEPIKLTKSI